MATILVVEDHRVNAQILCRILQREGHTVQHARDGREAVAMARANRPAVVLMDLSLPEMDGLEATRRLKSDSATRHIPVIALTAHAQLEDVERALEAGCDRYEIKPLQYRRLLHRISELIGRLGP